MKDSLHLHAMPSLFERARSLRKRSTLAENILWKHIRNRRVCKTKFRRQHPVLSYIVDFYSHEYLLVIEVDGGYHFTKEQQEYDHQRSLELMQFGLKVIRFSNEEIMNDINGVLIKISNELTSP
ncbi:hypothetical protein D3C78_1323980 [compost metagenome]